MVGKSLSLISASFLLLYEARFKVKDQLSLKVGADLCLKYYRAPRYRMRCVIIVLIERKCTGCTNKWSSLLEITYIYKYLNEVQCVLFVCVQNCVRIACAGTELWMPRFKMRYWKSKRVPEYNKFQGWLSM